MDGKIRTDAEGKGSAIFPPAFETAHASNIIVVPTSGDLLCAWFSGDSEGGDGVAIGRGLHSSTSQLNLGVSGTTYTLNTS
jgi:hypothetical protein